MRSRVWHLTYVGRQLQDPEAGYRRKVTIIGKKSCAADCQCRHNLERIRRLDSRCGSQLCGGAQMITRNICYVDAATLREKSFISPGQQMVSRTVGNDQGFEQGKRRCSQLLAALTHFSKKGLNQWKKPRMFFDEVDEDGRVHPYRAATEIGHQSHEARSRLTCFDGSTPLQCSLPNPLRSRIDRGFDVSRASLRR